MVTITLKFKTILFIQWIIVYRANNLIEFVHRRQFSPLELKSLRILLWCTHIYKQQHHI